MSVNTRSPLVIGIAVLVGLALVALGVVYWAEPAQLAAVLLPGPRGRLGHHHVKHGIASFFVGLALLVFAWFQTGEESSLRDRRRR